jgi:Xaa-Pro aminopeptidase
VSKTGRKIAVVGRYDVENVERMGGYDEVIGYDSNIQPTLLEVLEQLKPKQIAVNYSESDSSADGLSHGMYLRLMRYLKDQPYEVISAGSILSAVRGRKSASEIGRIRKAIAMTEEIIDGVTGMLKPGLSELDLANWIHDEFKRRGVPPAWEAAYCPIVNCGPESSTGHTGPSDKLIAQAGHLVHIDLGVTVEDYVSDLQRVWYIQPKGETEIPQAILDVFEVVNKAIQAAADILIGRVKGWEVDAAARKVIVESGHPEFQHALGHHIGRTVHDGSSLLGPLWDKYGTMPEGVVEVGNIFTLELGVDVEGYGTVSLEEDVLVTADGIEWLSTRQTAPIVVGE